jgi:cleavage and polyadenylation specificity factor subunit 1
LCLFFGQQSYTFGIFRRALETVRDTVSLVLLTLDLTTAHYPIIFKSSGLPYDSISLRPCPQSLGGVLVLTANSILHVDQSSKIEALATNAWATKVSALKYNTTSKTPLALEGAQLCFPHDELALVFLKTGEIWGLRVVRDGRSVSGMRLTRVGMTSPASVVEMVGKNFIFVGSEVGDGALIRWSKSNNSAEDDEADGMDLDEDMDDEVDDIYRVAKPSRANGKPNRSTQTTKTGSKRVIELDMCDSLPAYGPIRGLAVGEVAENVRNILLGLLFSLKSHGESVIVTSGISGHHWAR